MPEETAMQKKIPTISRKTLVLLVVTLVLSVLAARWLHYWSSQFMNTDKGYPEFSLSCYPNTNGDFVLEARGDHSNPIHGVDWQLKARDGSILEEGYLVDIYNQDLDFGKGNISFIDKDRNGYLNTGDLFYLRSTENGGLAEPGMRLRVVFAAFDATMSSCKLVSGGSPVSYQFPSTHWKTIERSDMNLSVDSNIVATNFFAPSYNNTLEFRMRLTSIHSESKEFFLRIRGPSGVTYDELRVVAEPNQTVEVSMIISLASFRGISFDYSGEMSFQFVVYPEDEWPEILTAELDIEITFFLYHVCNPSFSSGPLQLTLACLLVTMVASRRRRKRI